MFVTYGLKGLRYNGERSGKDTGNGKCDGSYYMLQGSLWLAPLLGG